jgi:hypothetical protein
MEYPCTRYKTQLKKAKETLEKLLIGKTEINSRLMHKPSSASLNKNLRDINMDIRITENEIEHLEYCIKRCESEYNSSI